MNLAPGYCRVSQASKPVVKTASPTRLAVMKRIFRLGVFSLIGEACGAFYTIGGGARYSGGADRRREQETANSGRRSDARFVERKSARRACASRGARKQILPPGSVFLPN